MKWSTPIGNYQEIDGRKVPSSGATIWHYPEGDFTYGRFTLKDIKYNVREYLPIVHCRDCGATGWAGLRPQQEQSRLAPNDLQSFYRAFFGRSPLVTYIFPNTSVRTTIAKHDRGAKYTLNLFGA